MARHRGGALAAAIGGADSGGSGDGVCEVDVPEWLFDIDYPGHYFRRLKTVGLSIPAVVGRGASVNATLTLLNSKVRESSPEFSTT